METQQNSSHIDKKYDILGSSEKLNYKLAKARYSSVGNVTVKKQLWRICYELYQHKNYCKCGLQQFKLTKILVDFIVLVFPLFVIPFLIYIIVSFFPILGYYKLITFLIEYSCLAPYALFVSVIAMAIFYVKYVCTTARGGGFISYNGLFITNHHVIDQYSAPYSFVTFDGNQACKFIPKKFFYSVPPDYDCTIVQLEDSWKSLARSEVFGTPLYVNTTFNKKLTGLNIVHFGKVKEQRMKVVSLGGSKPDGFPVEGSKHLIGYELDTESGSSGCTILDNYWDAVGIHHSHHRDNYNVGTLFSGNLKKISILMEKGLFKKMESENKAYISAQTCKCCNKPFSYYVVKSAENEIALAAKDTCQTCYRDYFYFAGKDFVCLLTLF